MADRLLAARMGRRSREMAEERFGLPAVMRRLEQAYRGERGASQDPCGLVHDGRRGRDFSAPGAQVARTRHTRPESMLSFRP